jgi:DtxR family Mn-dependent transcriptional regulator
MPTLSVENYVKAIYQLGADEGRQATTGELAKRLGVSPGSVTGMLRTLAESGLADYQAYGGVRLTPAGEKLALVMLRRHRLIELFLVRTLGLNWDEVHEEAEHLEHAVSDALIDRIDAYLAHPERDPHGDPIPRSDGTLSVEKEHSLAEHPTDAGFRLVRVTVQTGEFLRHLDRQGLTLGVEGTVVENEPVAGAMTVRVGERLVTLGLEAASRLRVTAIGAS